MLFYEKKVYNKKAENIPVTLKQTGNSLKNKGINSASIIFKFVGKTKRELFQKPVPNPINKSLDK